MTSENETIKQRNSAISVLFIIINVVLSCALFGLFNNDDPDGIGLYLVLSISFTILLGIYAFSYRGKAYRLGKWLFAISLIISICSLGLLWYVIQLAKAFQH